MVSVGFERGARKKKKQGQSFVLLCFLSRTHEKRKKKISPSGPFSSASFFTARALFAPHAQTRDDGQKEKDHKTIFALPDRVSGGKDTEKPLVHATIFLLLSLFWEKKPRRERTNTKEAKRTHTYLDTLGSRNPPGASPDTTNRSSRPRLSTEYRRCPELRSLTRTPYKIRAKKKLDMCIT